MGKTVLVKVNPGYCLQDGKKDHLPGDSVELPEKDAADLIDRGIVSPVKEDPPAAGQGAKEVQKGDAGAKKAPKAASKK